MSDSLPCIRCGQCEIVCPVDLQPQFLHAAIQSEAWEQLDTLALDACLFCQACTVACPSQIPLRDQFLDANATVKQIKLKKQTSSESKKRFEAKESRLARKQELQEAQRLNKLKHVPVDKKQAAIAAALARAQWKYEDA